MYIKSAHFYNAIYKFKDYDGASKQLHSLIEQYHPNASTLLDVACGTGKHLGTLQNYYQVQGLDISPEILTIARNEFPAIPFHEENMIDFNLGHQFDVITCLFSSIAYVKTVKNLNQAVSSMADHLELGGIMVIEPWVSPENYWRNKIIANFVDEPDLKISWMYAHEMIDLISVFNINYLVGTPLGVEHFTELHEMGLFTHQQYLDSFQKAGLKVEYDVKGLFGRGMYLGFK
ncbi:MAG: class I SAM-dependent methyltransferase [Saprospiraceae bacterium]